jgi:methylglyoxal/glyoxal reductase
MTLTINSTIRLNNGVEMPIFGLGTFRAERGRETQEAVRWALEAGYRHIDTAMIYGNEQDVGEGLRQSGVPREEVFITTKVWNGDQGYEATLRAYDESLKRLGVETVDLYLVHWPIKETRADTWRALLRIHEEKRVRAIGVSNYTIRHLEQVAKESAILPTVNQFEVHVYFQRRELVDYCQARGIAVESYSPLTRGRKLDDPALTGIARRYGKTPAQLMIRWTLQKGMVVIPKSVHRQRILENASVFDFAISDEDMQTLAGMDENFQTIRPGFMEGEW